MVLGIHSNVDPDGGFKDGHAWLSVRHSSGDAITVGLYPDGHPAVIDNGSETDLRLNVEMAATGKFEGKYNYYHNMTNLEAARFSAYLNKSASWLYSNTCATWAANGFRYGTGTNVSAREWLLFGTPRTISNSIQNLSPSTP